MVRDIGSIAAGTVIGHGISNALFGPHGGAMQSAQEQDASQQQMINEPCSWDARAFRDCLTSNPNDIGACQQAYDSLRACYNGSSMF